MTVSFIVLAHSNPGVLNELLRELRSYPVFLHVDRPALDQVFLRDSGIGQNGNVRINPSLRCLHWGGYSIFEAMMDTLRFALEETTPAVEHFVFLSGQCFPLRPVHEFTDYLESTDTPVLCRAIQLEESGHGSTAMDISRISRRHWLDGAVGHTKKVVPLVGSGARRIMAASTRFFSVRMPDLLHACGSQWVSVPRQLAHELVQNHQSGKFEYLRHSYAPDEMAIPTYVYNSQWSEMTPKRSLEHAREGQLKVSQFANFHWVRPDMDGVVSSEDIEKALISNQYFIRKMSLSKHGDPFAAIRKTW